MIMYFCVREYMCVHVYMYVGGIHGSTHVYMHVCRHTYMNLYICVDGQMSVGRYLCKYACMDGWI